MKTLLILFAVGLMPFISPLSSRPALAQELVFFHSPSCFHCRMWRDDNEDIYAKTEEGQRLPLREVNLDRGVPADLSHLSYPNFTPTFVVLDGDQNEVGRIVGYNDEFFWAFLNSYLEQMDAGTASKP